MRSTPRGRAAALILVACVAAASVPVLAQESPAAIAPTPDTAAPDTSSPGGLASAFEELAGLLADDEKPRALRRLRAVLDERSAEASDPLVAAQLAGLVEFMRGGLRGEFFGDLPKEVLGGVALVPGPGTHDVYARLAGLTGERASLAPLVHWEFVGPFENERGRAMRRRTPAEKDPSAGPFEGKVTDVDWRPLPQPAADGIHRVDRFVYPRAQYAIVARTWVNAPGALDAYVLVGASEEVRAWWNGDSVIDARESHTFAEDAHAARVTLNAGWNELTLKVGAQEGVCKFTARLVDAETGAPLALHAAGAPPEGVEGRRLSGRAKGGETAPGGLGALREAAAARALDLGEELALAALEAGANAVPKAKRPGYETARAALDAHPESLTAALLVLGTMRVEDALDVEEDVNPWLAVLRAALERHGERTLLLLAYADHASNGQGLMQRAQAFCERAIAANPNSVAARWAALAALHDRGLTGLANGRRAGLAQDPQLAERPTVARSLAGTYGDADPERARLLALASDAGDREAADLLRELEAPGSRAQQRADWDARLASDLEEDPSAVAARIQHARARLAAGDAEGAVALLDEVIVLCPDDPTVRGFRARTRYALGDFAGAAGDLERALEVDRSDTDGRRLLEHVRTRLDSSTDAAASFYAPFDEPLADIIARHPAPESASNEAPREALLERTVVEVSAKGTARRYRRSVQRILGERGVRDLDGRTFRAWPGQEEVLVLGARVLSPDGTVREARTGRTGARGAFTVDFPPLAIGDVVDIEWRRDDLQPSVFGSYFGLDAPLVSDPSLPQREAEVVLLERPGVELSYHLAGDADDLDLETRSGGSEDGSTFRAYLARGYEPTRREAYEPPPAETLPRVQASTYADWDQFGRWWWNLIDEEITSSDEMQAKVRELTAGIDDPLEQLRAIYGFVVTDVRYNAWEFGIHGYQPYSAPVILSRRFGDCKDKAILLKAMLAEVGIEAWPVVIDSQQRREDEDLELALVGHFNHCIAYVPEQDGVPEMFLDGTARLHPLEVLPDSDAGAEVLVVREDGVARLEVPFKSADENLIADEMTIDLTDPNAPAVELVRRPRGRWDPRERSRFEGDESEREERLEQLLTSIFGPLRGPARAEHPDYQDLRTPLDIAVKLAPEDIGRATGTGRELPSTFAAQDLLSSVAAETERTKDVLLDVPWSSVQSIEYVLPAGARVVRAPESIELGCEDLQYSRTVDGPSTGGDGLTRVRIVERIAFLTHRVPVERYAAFREIARRVDDAQRETLDFEL